MAAENAIFISYRRSDSAYVTGHIHNQLRSHFGQGIVFLDVDSIPLGVDFRKHLKQSVCNSHVLIAVIGDRWLEALQQRAANDASQDWVREEIETALAFDNMPVIPLLIENAKMPEPETLPEGMQDLVYRNGTQVRAALDFEKDIDRLIQGLEEIVGAPSPVDSVPDKQNMPAFAQVKLEALEQHLSVLMKKFTAAYAQKGKTLNDTAQVSLDEEIQQLEQEIESVNQKISALKAAHQEQT